MLDYVVLTITPLLGIAIYFRMVYKRKEDILQKQLGKTNYRRFNNPIITEFLAKAIYQQGNEKSSLAKITAQLGNGWKCKYKYHPYLCEVLYTPPNPKQVGGNISFIFPCQQEKISPVYIFSTGVSEDDKLSAIDILVRAFPPLHL